MQLFIDTATKMRFFYTNTNTNTNTDQLLSEISIGSIKELIFYMEVCTHRAILGLSALLTDETGEIREVARADLLELDDEYLAKHIVEIPLIEGMTQMDITQEILRIHTQRLQSLILGGTDVDHASAFEKAKSAIEDIKTLTWSDMKNKYKDSDMVETITLNNEISIRVDHYNLEVSVNHLD